MKTPDPELGHRATGTEPSHRNIWQLPFVSQVLGRLWLTSVLGNRVKGGAKVGAFFCQQIR